MSNNSVTVPVFKLNILGIAGLLLVSVLTLLFFFYLFVHAQNYLWLFLPVVVGIIILRYSGKSIFKIRIVDEKQLNFSTRGIHYGNDFYPLAEIEAIAIYLYAFENFEYGNGLARNKGSVASGFYQKAPGDRNKISFRSHETVLDFDFYIDDFARFIIIKKVVNDWVAQGVNVVLKQAFDDDFMIHEIDYYRTPTGL